MHSAMKKWNKIKRILSKALELEGEERDKYVKNTCGDDKELLDEVLSLIAAHEMTGALDQPLDAVRVSAIEQAKRERMRGKRIGKFKIIKELGYGGMGSVYLAERADGEFDQHVALKLIHSPFATEADVRRFKSERQILASLQHDHIARLLDGGVTDQGQPYYVMEYVDGKPIDEYCNDHRLTIDERLNLFIDVCRAVQYAHRKLVVHRDLKPSNILVTHDGSVKLLDFGIAKVLGERQSNSDAPITRHGLLPLTPSYASPEQVCGEDVTTSSDIYQLGVVLYELLTGNRPYGISGLSPGEIEHIICEELPTRPSIAVTTGQADKEEHAKRPTQSDPVQLKKKIRGDLDTVILKALHKEPDRRYESAEQLGTDIKLYLSDRPVSAHPDSRTYRAKKYIRRHQWGVSATIAVFLSLIIGIGTALWQAREAESALAKTEEALNRAEALHGFLTDLFLPGALDRPADQLPDTEELLEMGAEKALKGDISDPAERLGMLVTLGGIYIQRGWPDEARPLVDAAIELGYEHKDEWPQDLARALFYRARLASWDGERDKSEQLYLEAEDLLNDLDQHWELYAEAKSGRGYLEYYRGNYNRALAIAEPLHDQLEQQTEPDQHLKNRILNLLAITYGYLGELGKADQFQNKVINNYKELDGDDSRTYAISLTNSINIKYNLGDFESAGKNAREAISIYEKIYDSPTSVLGVTYGGHSVSKLFEGRFNEALSTVETAGRHFAHVRNKDFEEWGVPKIYRGMMLAKMQRWSEAEPYLVNNREFFNDVHHSMLFTTLDGLLAETLCRSGRIEEGMGVLSGLNDKNDGSPPDNPVYAAQIYEAAARCHFEEGNPDRALQDIEKSIKAMDYPGRAMERAERKLFHAELLADSGQHLQAQEELEKAEQLFLDLGMPDHPFMDRAKHRSSQLITQQE